jgi:hypothetical protein
MTNKSKKSGSGGHGFDITPGRAVLLKTEQVKSIYLWLAV